MDYLLFDSGTGAIEPYHWKSLLGSYPLSKEAFQLQIENAGAATKLWLATESDAWS